MASINYLDDNAGDYTRYNSSDSYDAYQPEGSYGSYQAPSYQPEASPSKGSFSLYPNTGISGMGDLSQFLNQSQPRPETPQYKPWNFNSFQQDAQRIASGYSGSLDDFVNQIFPQLSSQYQGLERFGSKGDKIRLPNGQVIDAVIAAGEGGRGYNWNPEAGTSGDSYSSDPLIGQYIDRMNGLIDRLSQPQPINATLQDAIGKLQGMFNNPGYTDAQRALMRTNLQEPLESQRASAQQRALARASDRGLGIGSGVLEQEAQGIDMGFDRLLGEALRQMSVNEIQQQNAQRAGAAGQLAGIGQGLQGQELQALAQALGGTSQLGQLPIQLQQAQIAAMNALNQQRIPQQDDMNGLIGLLMGLAGQGENAYNNAMGQEGGFWSSLFGQIPAIYGAVTGNNSSLYGDVLPETYPHA